MTFDGNKFVNRLLLIFVMFTLTAAAFEGFFVKWVFHDNDFDAFLDGSLIRPWVYRRLVPETANAFRAALNDDQAARLTETLEQNNFLSEDFRRTDVQPRYIIEYYFMYAVTFVCFLISAFMWRRLATEVTSDPIAGTLAAMLFTLLFPLIETSGGYFYDFSELLFFATAVWLASRGKWIALLILTPVAEFNKESFFFMLFTLYPLLRQSLSLRKTLWTLGTAIVTAGLIYVWIHHRYSANDGWTTIYWLPQNIETLAPLVFVAIACWIVKTAVERRNKQLITAAILILSIALSAFFNVPIAEQYFIIEQTYSVPSGEKLFLPHLLMIFWLIKCTWSRLPTVWRRHALIACAINLPLWILFCFPGELRNLSMLYPTLVLMLAFYIDGVIKR